MSDNKILCECGHQNPHGTIICESCGKPLEDKDSGKLINMRYEGSARRSQTYKKTFVDKIWNFFSSVKVGVWLIVVTLIASAVGTIFPQEMYIPQTVTPAEYYEMEYGFLGKLYFSLGFHNLYGSWWYMILIASIGISIVIASLDRFIPLYRALRSQSVTRHDSFMKRQRFFSATKVEDDQDDTIKEFQKKLVQKRYKVKEEHGNLFAEKARFSRWGPYVNHTGLIIFLIGGLLRFVPGMYIDETLWLREGETKVIPGTEGQYFLKNEKFIMEVYEKGEEEKFDAALDRVGGMVAKNYQTNAVLYERKGDIVAGAEPELDQVKREKIRVNEPLKFDGYAVYQVDYKLNELNKMNFKLEQKSSEKSFGEISIDLVSPKKLYDLGNGYKVELLSYFPDFYFDDNGPATRTKIPNNPAFIFNMVTPEHPKGEISFVAIRQNIEPNGENEYKMTFNGIETLNVAGLTVRRDYTLGIIALGGFIFMIGVIQGMYWNHRRIWLKKSGNDILLAAHTNKNWYALKRELESLVDGTSIVLPADQLDAKGEKDKKKKQGGKGDGTDKQ